MILYSLRAKHFLLFFFFAPDSLSLNYPSTDFFFSFQIPVIKENKVFSLAHHAILHFFLVQKFGYEHYLVLH
jgi:hypothetical protein